MKNRIEVFEQTIEAVRKLDIPSGYASYIESIIDQIEFLINFEKGDVKDIKLLQKINIGIIAARIIEEFDIDVAMKVHTSSGEWMKMKQENELN